MKYIVDLLRWTPPSRWSPSHTLSQLRRKAESGFDVTIQAIYYILLLFIFFALIFDFGSAGFAATSGNEAMRMAAQDAAKNIDEMAFLNDQEVRLNNDALDRAQDLVTGMTDGNVTVTSVSISRLNTRDVIVVQGTAAADLPVLGSLFGMAPLSIQVEAYAEPAYGISQEGQ